MSEFMLNQALMEFNVDKVKMLIENSIVPNPEVILGVFHSPKTSKRKEMLGLLYDLQDQGLLTMPASIRSRPQNLFNHGPSSIPQPGVSAGRSRQRLGEHIAAFLDDEHDENFGNIAMENRDDYQTARLIHQGLNPPTSPPVDIPHRFPELDHPLPDQDGDGFSKVKTYCVKCKQKTGGKMTMTKSKNGCNMLRGKCSVCGCNKCSF
jgi:hypothetical protein